MFDSVEEIESADRTKIVQYLMAVTPGGLAEGESTNDLRAAAIESFETEEMEHEDFDASHMEGY